MANIRKYGKKGGRMEADFSGLYTIETISGNLVTLKHLEGAILKNKYNIGHLKPYKRSSQPTTHPSSPYNDHPCVKPVKPTLRPQQSLDKADDPEAIKHNLPRPCYCFCQKLATTIGQMTALLPLTKRTWAPQAIYQHRKKTNQKEHHKKEAL